MKFEFIPKNIHIEDAELLSDIKRVANQVSKQSISLSEYAKYGIYSGNTISNRFGSWNSALIKAGLQVRRKYKYSDEEFFENMEAVWRKLGKQPSRNDLNKENGSKISCSAYENHFGTWNNALQQFVIFINLPDTPSLVGDAESTDGHKTKREINLRLRFRVLQRDNFKCCSCGASPAKDPSIELHVDHILPWSKGGETVIENLQTLCSKCNLGKSDLTFD